MKTVSYLKPYYTSTSWQTRERYADDSWDRGDSASDHSVSGLTLVETDEYKSLPLNGDVKVGDVIYLIWATYSTGDSFGHDENGEIEFVSLHRDKDVAQANLDILQSIKAGEKFVLHTDEGKAWQYYPPWFGYFEHLNELRMEGFVVR